MDCMFITFLPGGTYAYFILYKMSTITRRIWYHGNCKDGFGAAYAAWKKFGDKDTIYVPVLNHGKLPLYKAGDEIYILDFCFSRQLLIPLWTVCPKLMIIDHHPSSRFATDIFKEKLIDETKSACVSAWEYFHPGKEVPWILRYVQDRDLWEWKLLDSEVANEGITTIESRFDIWENLTFSEALIRGEPRWKNKELLIEKKLAHTRMGNLSNKVYKGPRVPFIKSSNLISDLGDKLSRDSFVPYAVVWFTTGAGYVYCLRSNKKHGENVAKIAEKFNGTGHRNAASFLQYSPKHTLIKGQ